MPARRTVLKEIAAACAAPWVAGAVGSGVLAAVKNEVGSNGSQVAAPADSLVEFISVQTHPDWRSTVWDQEAWRPLLGELGVRHMRGRVSTPTARDHLTALNAEFGTRACALLRAINDDGTFRLDETLETLAFLRDEIGPELIFAIEGPNEYTSKYKTGNWAERLIDYQAFVYDAVKGDPLLAQHDVIAPTIWKRNVDEYRAIARLAPFADYGNLHLYSGGRKPSLFRRGLFDASMDLAIEDAQTVTPGKRICVTETGFRVAEAAPTSSSLPAEVAAKYTLRNVAELFSRRDRVRWMSIYSLIDDRGKDHCYGLLDLDLAPRPSYFALRNLIRLVEDPGPPFTPGALSFDLVTDEPEIRRLLLQKRDGRFFLVLWHDAECYDRRKRQVIENTPREATLDFAERRMESLRIFAPTMSDLALKELKGAASVELAVPDELLVVELVP